LTELQLTIGGYRITPTEYRRLYLADSWERLKRYRRFFAIFLFIGLFGLVALSLSAPRPRFLVSALWLWAPLVLFITLWPYVVAFSSAWLVSHTRARRGRLEVHEASVADGLLTVRTMAPDPTVLELDKIVRFSNCGTHYLVYPDALRAEVIPTAAFSSPSDREAFERQLKAKRGAPSP
jgi:hypothetical protein